MAYSNKNYSLEQFKKDYEQAKKVDSHAWCYAIFRLENKDKIPIGTAFEYSNAIALANMDCKESEGLFKDFAIEGIGNCAEICVMKFTIEFWEEITKQYRKNAKVNTIKLDAAAQEVAKKEKIEREKKIQAQRAMDKYFEEID